MTHHGIAVSMLTQDHRHGHEAWHIAIPGDVT